MLAGRVLMTLALLVGIAAPVLPGCTEKGPAEKAGAKVDETVEKMKDTIDPKGPAEKTGEKIDKAVDDLKD
jgi:hypothetical protein